jgi:hypothetical protein
MSGNSLGPAHGRRQLYSYLPGDRVRINSGKLNGLTGVVGRSTSLECLLMIDSWPEGVYLLLTRSAVALSRHNWR